MKFTTLEKVFGVLWLALIVGFISKPPEVERVQSCPAPADRDVSVRSLNGEDTTLSWLQEIYPALNGAYFEDKLPEVKIDLLETDKRNMASTSCSSANTNCTIHFNPKYIVAPRHAELVMLHEMCHIPTYDEKVPGATGQHALHGPRWRACMLKLDIQGANRYILIDYYKPMEAQLTVFK